MFVSRVRLGERERGFIFSFNVVMMIITITDFRERFRISLPTSVNYASINLMEEESDCQRVDYMDDICI